MPHGRGWYKRQARTLVGSSHVDGRTAQRLSNKGRRTRTQSKRKGHATTSSPTAAEKGQDQSLSVGSKSPTAVQKTATHGRAFFGQYPEFPYNPGEPVTAQFKRLTAHYKWRPKSKEFKNAKAMFKDALVLDFNAIYGKDNDDIRSWQALCGVVGVEPIPDKLDVCRQVVKAIHVNLVDLVDVAHGSCDRLELFATEAALSQYTRNTGKFFPKNNAYAGGLLKYLLRQILNPSKARGRGSTDISSDIFSLL